MNMRKLKEIVVASGNPDKIKEIRRILGLQAKPASVPDVQETGKSYKENAILKAIHAARLTGKPALGEDSGIEVKAIGGPGIYSKRWARSDKERINKVLRLLRGKRDRSARYVSAVALAFPDGRVITAQGTVRGKIVPPKGNKGFGYDPIFYYHPKRKTFGQMSSEEKDSVSHRGRALRKLKTLI